MENGSVLTTKNRRGRGRPRLTDAETREIRKKISTVARVLFIEEGYDGVSIRKIASKVPCSVGVLYNHFNNKREILQDIWDDIFTACFKHCYTAASRQKNILDKLRKFFIAYLEYWGNNPSHFRMIYLIDERESQDAYYASHSPMTHFDEWCIPLITEGLDKKILVSEKGMTEADFLLAFYNICQGLSYRSATQPLADKNEEKKFNEFAINAVLRGFSGPDAKGQS